MPGDHVGILNIDKPGGWTSHDVVARVRRVSGRKRVGHAGTLDPGARGVLLVLLGRATRLADYLHVYPKTYIARVALGASTDTDDADGTRTASAAVPHLSLEMVDAALGEFTGDIQQIPPAYSAVQVGGQRAYAVARRGGSLTLAPRQVTVHNVRLTSLESTALEVDVTCSSGTYVRALARDLALRLGTLGHLETLVRTRVGPFALQDALSLETLTVDALDAALQPPECALPDAPRFDADPEQAWRLGNGQSVPTDMEAEHVWVYAADGRLLGLGVADGQVVRVRVAL